MPRKRLAVFTATGCSACENTILDIHYQVSPLTKWAEFAFWPYLTGCQWETLERRASLDVCFFAGAISTEDDLMAAQRLRDRSKVLVACGACACFGGLPGLANLLETDPIQSTEDSDRESLPRLPEIRPRVSALSQVVEVDYFVPGCAPTQPFLWTAIQSLVCEGEATARISFAANRLPQAIASAVSAGVSPSPGTTFAGEKAVCASCSRQKEEKKFRRFYRPFELNSDSGRCLLEQGLVCQGLATTEGCGGLCTAVGAGCRGCFGKAPAVLDPGAKMVSAISSTFDSTDPAEIQGLSDQFVDLAGTFYRYTLPAQCMLDSVQVEE